jgi:hypothetical protein
VIEEPVSLLGLIPRIAYGYLTVQICCNLNVGAGSEAAVGCFQSRITRFSRRFKLTQIQPVIPYSPVLLMENDVIDGGRRGRFPLGYRCNTPQSVLFRTIFIFSAISAKSTCDEGHLRNGA